LFVNLNSYTRAPLRSIQGPFIDYDIYLLIRSEDQVQSLIDIILTALADIVLYSNMNTSKRIRALQELAL